MAADRLRGQRRVMDRSKGSMPSIGGTEVVDWIWPADRLVEPRDLVRRIIGEQRLVEESRDLKAKAHTAREGA